MMPLTLDELRNRLDVLMKEFQQALTPDSGLTVVSLLIVEAQLNMLGL